MVTRYILVFLFPFVCFSCSLLFRTPFPDELILMGDSVSLEDELGSFNDSHLYMFHNYVFLTISEDDEADRCFVFTDELEQIVSLHEGKYNTFGMIDANLDYVIGNKIFNPPNFEYPSNLPDININGAPYDPYHPSNWGFSYGGYNYYVWWKDNDTEKRIAYHLYDNYWSDSGSTNECIVNANIRLEYLAFEPCGGVEHDEPTVFLFFKNENSGQQTVYIFERLAESFYNCSLTIDIQSGSPVIIHDVDVEDFFYTRAGFILKEHDGTYLRISDEGKEVSRIFSSMNDVSEAYDIEGDNRYIFSHTYRRIARTKPWWK
jgi:hypothetical protein